MAQQKTILSLFVISLTVLLTAFSGNQCFADENKDRAALMKAVKGYFEAEIAGDKKKIWDLLAPSSVFKKRYSYADYQEMMKGSRLSLKSYSIERVLDIKDNPDKQSMPDVEKIAVIQVRVKMGGEGEPETEHTSALTFLKEQGKWFKG